MALKPGRSVGSLALYGACLAILAVWSLVALTACSTESDAEIEIRINNISQFDFTDVSIGDQSYGDIAAGRRSEYLPVRTRLGYAVINLTADGRKVTGQTLNYGAKRYTYNIDVVDLLAGQLAIDVIAEEDP